jgi:hydroxyacylglutathione hydrolase
MRVLCLFLFKKVMINIHHFVFSPLAENTYILFDETQEAVIIDPGCNSPKEEKTLQDFITAQKLKVVKLLNTHCHLDHVFGNQFVKDTYQVKLYAHPLEVETLKWSKIAAPMFGVSRFIESTIDEFIDETNTIAFGNSSLEILFVPGHAPGHIAFVNKAEKFVIGGDVLFQRGIGRTDFPGCSQEQLLQSIREKFFTLEDDVIVYTGHGPETSIGFEKRYNPFLM